MQTSVFFTLLAFLSSSARAADVGATGEIETLDAGLEGRITVKDENTLEITNYKLEDASAPALYWWGATTEDLGAGFRINTEMVTDTADGSGSLTVELNNGYSANDFEVVGLWCETFDLNFGQAQLEGGSGSNSEGSNNTSSDENSSSSEEAENENQQSGAGKAGVAVMALAVGIAAFMV